MRPVHFEPHCWIVRPNQASSAAHVLVRKSRVGPERHLWRRFNPNGIRRKASPLTCVFALLGVTFSGSSGSWAELSRARFVVFGDATSSFIFCKHTAWYLHRSGN